MKFTWLMPRIRAAGAAHSSGAGGAASIPAALAIVGQIIEDCRRGWWQPVQLQRLDIEPFSVAERQAFDRANQLGLPTPDLPDSISPREVYLHRRRLELGMMDMVGEAGLQHIDDAAEETKLDLDDSWACLIWGHDRIGKEGVYAGRWITPARKVGLRGGVIPVDFIAQHPWDERYRGYRFEVFGRHVASQADVDDVPPEAIWHRRLLGDPSLVGGGLLAIAVCRAQVFHRGTPVYGRVDWRPGWDRVKYSYHAPSLDDDTKIARAGLRLYRGILTSGGRPRTSEEEALAEAVRLAREWLDRHPDKLPEDFGRAELAAMRVMSLKGLGEWMRVKRVTIQKIREQLRA